MEIFKNLWIKFYQKNKERFHKKANERYQGSEVTVTGDGFFLTGPKKVFFKRYFF